jgi:hypothetical protein
MDDAIARFRPKLARFLEETQLELRPPISSAELERFETRHKVRLLEAYREFLLRVTNGIVWMDGNLVLRFRLPSVGDPLSRQPLGSVRRANSFSGENRDVGS